MATIDEALDRLQRSRFRSRFHLTEKDRAYIRDKGWDTIARHGADFIATRLAPAEIPAILESRDRSRAGPTLPAKGLFLKCVEYDL